jgi:hypothetical protein
MSYIENPKTKGSGIICAIPQTGTCPVGCEDCFFQGGRSYLEPLSENLPNVPDFGFAYDRIVRMNDGNDSNVNRQKVQAIASEFRNVFFNTSIPNDLTEFGNPVVLTVNPGKRTDESWHKLDPIPPNLMFVRFRSNVWNKSLLREVIDYYTPLHVPVVITFMAYHNQETISIWADWYEHKQRTLNSYWVLKQSSWDFIVYPYLDNPYVYTCGKNAHTFSCQRCGNCVREYHNTEERLEELSAEKENGN